MVRLCLACFRKYGNFLDNLRLYVRGGSGGMGLPRLGGHGGEGGSVWVVASEKMTLRKLKDKYPRKRFVAGAGGNSSVRSLKGDKGEDCEVLAPVGITVTDDNDSVLGHLNEAGERVMVARGGRGGTFSTSFQPSRGRAKHIRLDLKLIADVGLVGFPNAGKSSLLTRVSNATPEVASYAFTTLKPQIGKIMYRDHKQVSVADLPGLIEGAHLNRGMGHKFLKHVERTKHLMLVVDVGGFQLGPKTPLRSAFEAVQLLTKELELYKEELLSKPALLVVNKMDLPEAEEKLAQLTTQLLRPHEFCHVLPEDMTPKRFLTFKELVPVSALTGLGVERLKSCVRASLDQEAEMETKELHEERLRQLRST